jgi:hypothetical protein
VVIFNLPETDSILKDDRIKHDTEMLNTIGSECGLELELSNEVDKMFRLGKKRPDDKPRPLLVALKDENTKRLLFSKLNKLKNCDEPLCNVTIQHDMTRVERDQAHELFLDAKKKTQSSGGKWLYKVRGPPWDQRIVRLKPKEDN